MGFTMIESANSGF